ncbi:MAG: DUF2723 domain-containing protein [Anaerolineae bacterium]
MITKKSRNLRSTFPVLGKLGSKWIGALAVFMVSMAIYSFTLAPGILGGDSGEFQFVPYSLGVAHPTGYPFYTILGWLWTHLIIIGSVAYRTNLLSALFGALTTSFLYLIVNYLTKSSSAALLAAILLGLSPTFWSQSIMAEVYTLNVLFVALIFYLLLVLCSRGNAHILYIVAFTYGLSLTHHRTMLVLLPVFVFFLLRARPKKLRVFRLVLVSLLPLLFYTYIPIRIWQLYPPQYYDQILDNLLGISFGPLLAEPRWSIAQESLILLWVQYGIFLALTPLGLHGGLVSVSRCCRPWIAALIVGSLGYWLFGLVYQAFDPEVFFIPLYFICAIWIGLGWWRLRACLQTTLRALNDTGWMKISGFSSNLPAFVSEGAVIALIAVWGIAHGQTEPAIAGVSVKDIPLLSEWVAHLTDQALAYPYPPDSTLLVEWGLAYPLEYRQMVDGLRPDLEVMPINLFRPPDYALVKELVAGRRPRSLYHLSRQVRYPIEPDRPLYVLDQPLQASTRVEADLNLVKLRENLVQVLPDTPRPAQELNSEITPEVTLVGFEVRGSQLHLYWRANSPLDQDYSTYVHFKDESGVPIGQQDKAGDDLEVLHLSTTQWKVGMVIRDIFDLPPGTAKATVGMYLLLGEEVRPYGQALTFDILDSAGQ